MANKAACQDWKRGSKPDLLFADDLLIMSTLETDLTIKKELIALQDFAGSESCL